jgi:hypothetical protein
VLRGGRGILENIIPSSTGAAMAAVIPDLNKKTRRHVVPCFYPRRVGGGLDGGAGQVSHLLGYLRCYEGRELV